MGRQRPFRWNLPPGVADPYFVAELCLELKMTRGELGRRMSVWELCVFWPAFFAERNRLAEIEQAKQQQQQRGFG
jgi:hypothetical protein